MIVEEKYVATIANVHLSVAQDLVTKMLHMDPTARLRAGEVLAHDWIVKRAALPAVALPRADPNALRLDMSKVYEAMTKPQQIALQGVQASSIARRRAKRLSLADHRAFEKMSLSGSSAESPGPSVTHL